MASRRPRQPVVFNATGFAFVFNAAGQRIEPGESRQASPDDPVTQLYISKGYLIVQEG